MSAVYQYLFVCNLYPASIFFLFLDPNQLYHHTKQKLKWKPLYSIVNVIALFICNLSSPCNFLGELCNFLLRAKFTANFS